MTYLNETILHLILGLQYTVPVFFSSKTPPWSPDSYLKIISNVNLNLLRYSNSKVFLHIIIVTDGVEGVCMDPRETGAILEAGGVGGPGPPGGGKGGQLASDSGGG